MTTKTRKTAPDGDVTDYSIDPMLKMELEYDQKNPDFKHLWKRLDAELGTAEPVLVGNEKVTNGKQMLCRVPIAYWDKKQRLPNQNSINRVKSVVNYDGSPFVEDELTKFANPKKGKLMEN